MPFFNTEKEVYETFKDVCRRERVDIGKKINELIIIYVKEHGDGNPNYSLDLFDHEEMKAVPAVFRSLPEWQEYISYMNEKDFREMESQVYAIKDKLDKRWEKGFG